MQNVIGKAEACNIHPKVLFHLKKTIPVKIALLLKPLVKYHSLILWAAILSFVKWFVIWNKVLEGRSRREVRGITLKETYETLWLFKIQSSIQSCSQDKGHEFLWFQQQTFTFLYSSPLLFLKPWKKFCPSVAFGQQEAMCMQVPPSMTCKRK